MGLLRLGLVSECRVTKNTANDTYFPILFFYFSNILVERFKTTLTSDDAKQKKWFMIPKVASRPDDLDEFSRLCSENETSSR